MEETHAVVALAALAQPLRLRLFRALVVVGQAGLSPKTMCEGLGVPASSLSFHLKELLRAGLITQSRASRHLIYRANFEHMDGLLAFLTDNCCQGAECAVSESQACAC